MSVEIFKYVDVALQSTFDSLATKDANTLYGVKDTKRMYFGDALVADKNVYFFDSALPASGAVGNMYVVNSGANKGLYRWDATVPDGESDPVGFTSIVSISEFIVTSVRSSASALDTVVPSEKAVAAAIEGVTANMEWKPSVANFAAIATTYPTPEEGWTVSVDDTNQIYRYDAATSEWVNIFTLTADVVVAEGEQGARNGLMTPAMAAKLSGIAAGAEVNQNAFSSVVVGSSTVSAASETDSFEITGGTNVSVSVDANDKIVITGPNKTSQITELDGYAIAATGGDLASTDTLNQALGKLEKRISDQESNITTTLSSDSTDTEVPSAKAVYDAIKVVHM